MRLLYTMPSPLALAATSALTAAIVYIVKRRQLRSSAAPCFDVPLNRSGTHAVKLDLSERPQALQLWVADMDLPCADAIRRALLERASHPNYGYTLQPRAAWDAVGRWLVERQRYPSPPPAESFVFSASVVTSCCSLLRALTSAGDAVVVMTPLYAPLQRAVSGAGRELVEHKLRWRRRCAAGEAAAYQMDVETRLAPLLEATPNARALVLCNPHNPGGRRWRREELAELAALCARRGLLVIADEIWADWCLPSERGGRTSGGGRAGNGFAPFAPLAAAAGCAHVVLGAPTKTFSLAGLHASYLIIPDEALREAYRAYAEPAFLTFGSTFATVAMLACYTEPEAARWLDAAIAHVCANLHALRAHLARHLGGRVVVLPLEATYCAWLDCAALGLRGEELKELFLGAGLVLSPGAEFDASGASDGYMRINLACARCTILEAARRICRAVLSHDALMHDARAT